MAEELPTDAFYDLTTLSRQVAVSPSGDRVAFVAVESDPDEDERRRSVFVVPTDGSRDPHRLTRVSDAGGMQWSPDGSKLGVVMARDEDVELSVGRDEESGAADDEDDREGSGDDAEDGDETGDDADEDGAGDDGDGGDEDEVGENGGDDEGPKSQVWVYDLEWGGDARQVTDREEGVEGFDWGPDGDRVVVAARDPDDDQQEYLEQVREDGPIEVERLQHKFDGKGWLDDVRSYLFVVDVETRESERLDDTGFPPKVGDGLSPAWGPGDRIAFRGYEPGEDEDPDDTHAQDLYTIAPDGTDRRRITDGEFSVGGGEWSPGGDRLAFTARDPENWYRPTEVYVADPADGDYRRVTAGLDRTVAWGGGPKWLDDERMAVLIGDGGRTRFARLHADGDPERVFEAQGEFEDVQAFDVTEGGRIACVVSRPQEGTDLYALDAGDLDAGDDPDAADRDPDAGDDPDAAGDPRIRLTDLNPDLVGEYEQPACRRETFTVESEGEDPVEVEAVVYHPPDFEPGEDDPLPFVLDIHGGPMAYDRPSWGFEDAFWTTRGYVVWKVNYRGSTSYGREFCEALKGRWNSLEVDDLLAGTDAAVERGYADPDRLFVTGFSQGGVNTAYVITSTDRFRAAAPEHGIYDARSCFGTDDSHNWWEADYGLPWENPEGYDSASSITDVDRIDTPTLVTAGENDWRCPPSQAEQLYVSIRKQGVPAKLVIYQNEHHNVGDPDRAIHRLETIEAWFAEHDPSVDDAESGDDGSEDDGEAGDGE